MYNELQKQIYAFKDPYELENFMENLAYSDDITHMKYASLYTIALDYYHTLLDKWFNN